MSKTQVRCQWLKNDGTPCREKTLVPGSLYCNRHYWQALWTKSQISEKPYPAKIEWGVISLTFLIIIAINTVYAINGNWVVNDGVNLFHYLQSNQLEDIQILRVAIWIIGVVNMTVIALLLFWLMALILAVYPLRPIRRRNQIIICFYLIIAVSLLSYINIGIGAWHKTYIQANWITSATTFLFLPRLIIIFSAANNLNYKLVDKYGVWPDVIIILVFLFSISMYIFYTKVAGSLLLMIGLFGIIGIILGVALISAPIRRVILTTYTETIVKLADSLHPLNGIKLGFTDDIRDVRSKALQKALIIYSSLTEIEQKEIDLYIITKHKPSPLELVMGTITIAISVFFLEAPLQQVFFWLTCSFFHLGPPLCS